MTKNKPVPDCNSRIETTKISKEATHWEELNADAGAFYTRKEYEKGVAVALRAVSYSVNSFGELHENTATSYNNLGLLYIAQKDYDKAESALRKALEIYEQTLGRKHEKALIVVKNLYELSCAKLNGGEPGITEAALNCVQESVLRIFPLTVVNGLRLLYASSLIFWGIMIVRVKHRGYNQLPFSDEVVQAVGAGISVAIVSFILSYGIRKVWETKDAPISTAKFLIILCVMAFVCGFLAYWGAQPHMV